MDESCRGFLKLNTSKTRIHDVIALKQPLAISSLRLEKQMLNDRKSRVILISILGIVLLASIALSMSLTGLPLRGGIESPDLPDNDPAITGTFPTATVNSRPLGFLQAAAAIVFLVLVVFLGIRMVKIMAQQSAQWKGVWKLIVPLLCVVLLMVFLGKLTPAGKYESLQEEVIPTAIVTTDFTDGRTLEPPTSVRWVALAALAAGVGLIAILGSRKQTTSNRIDPIKQQAESAAALLISGEDFRSVLMRCYFEMARVIREENDIEREPEMTVREFEAVLTSRGFEIEPIQRLGHLFEKARYSNQPITDVEKEQGIACLQKIAGQSDRKEGDDAKQG